MATTLRISDAHPFPNPPHPLGPARPPNSQRRKNQEIGGGNGVALPRLSERFDVVLNNMEPQQEHLRDDSTNVAPYRGKDKYPSAQHHFSSHTHFPQVSTHLGNLFPTDLITPVPLRTIPAGKISKGMVSPTRRHGLVSVPSTTYADTSGDTCSEDGRNLQLACWPAEHDQHMEHGISVMSLSYSKQISDGERCDVAEPCSKAMFPSTKYRAIRDRFRKARISEGIKALRNIVPCSGNSDKGNEADVLDDAIDYVKYLKLQLKMLSQSRLSGESTSHPFVHLEGYGHYLLHQRVGNEPLEDVMGNLLEMKPQAANALLESKGLHTLPMDFAYALLQAT